MPLELDSGLGVGFGFASVLLQTHLGIGLLLVVLGSAAASVPAVQKRLEGTAWEGGLKAAAAAAGPAPLLAVFGLIQAVGARSDVLTWAGLLASTGAALLGALHVVLCPAFGVEVPAVNSGTGGVLCAPFAEDAGAALRFSAASRTLSSLRACGGLLLLLSSLPGGVQLLCASLLLRLTLALHVLDAGAHALSVGSGGGAAAGIRSSARGMAGAAPLIATIALMDYVAFGPGSALLAFLQPVVYCSLAALLQLGLAMAVGASVNGSVGGPEQPHDKHLGHLAAMGLSAAMAVGVARVLAGIVSVEASTAGLAVQWGEPLFAAACCLAALLAAAHLADACAGHGARAPAPNHVNGSSPEPEDPSAIDHAKAIVLPTHGLVLALLAAHLSSLEPADAGALGAALAAVASPLKYGLLLAAAAVAAQLLLLALFLASGAPASAPRFDAAGTPLWPAEGGAPPAAAERARSAVLMLLEGGLLAGLAGLGVWPWLPLAAVAGPCVGLLLPADARKWLLGLLCACGGAAGGSVEYLAEVMQAYAKQRQYAKEVLHAQKADAMAAEVEKELAAASSEARAGKQPPKGPRAAKAPSSGEAKAGKAKRASTGGRHR